MTAELHNQAEFKAACLRQLQWEYTSLFWRRNIKTAPASLALMKSEKYWGQWLPSEKRILINEDLFFKAPWEAVLWVLGHEAAHQLAEERDGGWGGEPHGPAFQKMAELLNVPPGFRSAVIDLKSEDLSAFDPDESAEVDVEGRRLLEKVKKLLALGSSPVEAEAQAAMAAASKLMARHNVKFIDGPAHGQDSYARLTVDLDGVRIQTRHTLAAGILNAHFFVETIFVPVYNPQKNREDKKLEIFGRPENARLAEHVFRFLMERCESLWREHQRLLRRENKDAGGNNGRLSFMVGLLKGFKKKLDEAAASENFASQGGPVSALVLARDRGLRNFIRRRHPKLASLRRGGLSLDSNTLAAGEAQGRNLNIHRPVEDSSGRPFEGPAKALPIQSSYGDL